MATPNRINDQGVEELLCSGCMTWFVPKDGEVDVYRISVDDPGGVVCKECLGAMVSRGLMQRDLEEAKCHCESLDPAHQVCPIHFVINNVN